METLIKIGDARYPDNPAYLKCWLDGQIVTSRDDGFKWGPRERENFLILRTTDDFWTLRGRDQSLLTQQNIAFKKLLSRSDSTGKYSWEFGFLANEKRLRRNDYFIDINLLLKNGLITQSIWDNLYAHGQETGIINLGMSLFTLAKHELTNIRTLVDLKNQALTEGTYQIGTGDGADYATWNGFEADISTPLTGDLIGEGQNEQTEVVGIPVFDTQTLSYTLRLTSEAGAEHNGGAYGSGARILIGSTEKLMFDETTDGHLANIEVSKLALSCVGYDSAGVYLNDCGKGGGILVNRMLIQGDASNTRDLIDVKYDVRGTTTIRNSILYGSSSGYHAMYVRSYGGVTVNILNNTVCKNAGTGIHIYDGNPTIVAINNLCQGNGVDYDNPAYIDTHSKNVDLDGTSPDSLQRDVTDAFLNYAGNDFRLNPDGDVDDLAYLEAGDDLSGTFSDDVVGTTRSTWYIGAFEVPAAGGQSIVPLLVNKMGGNCNSMRGL